MSLVGVRGVYWLRWQTRSLQKVWWPIFSMPSPDPSVKYTILCTRVVQVQRPFHLFFDNSPLPLPICRQWAWSFNSLTSHQTLIHSSTKLKNWMKMSVFLKTCYHDHIIGWLCWRDDLVVFCSNAMSVPCFRRIPALHKKPLLLLLIVLALSLLFFFLKLYILDGRKGEKK